MAHLCCPDGMGLLDQGSMRPSLPVFGTSASPWRALGSAPRSLSSHACIWVRKALPGRTPDDVGISASSGVGRPGSPPAQTSRAEQVLLSRRVHASRAPATQVKSITALVITWPGFCHRGSPLSINPIVDLGPVMLGQWDGTQ